MITSLLQKGWTFGAYYLFASGSAGFAYGFKSELDKNLDRNNASLKRSTGHSFYKYIVLSSLLEGGVSIFPAMVLPITYPVIRGVEYYDDHRRRAQERDAKIIRSSGPDY